MTAELPAPVRAMIDAANDGDLAGFLAGFTDDGVVDDWGREFRGAAQIRAWSDAEFIGRQVTLAVREISQLNGNTVVSAQVGGNGFNGPSHFSFLVSGDLVSRLAIRA